MAPTSPTVARWELALRIKRRREELGISVKEITDHLGFSRNYWSAVENERAVLAEDKFDGLLRLFKFTDQDASELRDLRVAARQRGWWDSSTELDDEMKRFVGLEQGAVEIRNFESLLIPGLLQTRDYARAYLTSDPMFGAVDVEPLVATRERRQGRLDDHDPLRFVT
ncbi:MAG: Scr1 family TA system antitoxin-like transcriptional regulator, partial [Acidimicrobiia bacterium]|nr:Scr1 family TA system antitoxin-like transcriptional regulator [Acidimicrobiia bacterium]